MPQYEDMEVLVLVKAAPVMTVDLDETMCVAGVRIDGGRNEWVRLHPVPFRDMTNDSRFKKYQRITATCIRHRTDRRPETWTPIEGSIRVVGAVVPATRNWELRRRFIDPLDEMTTCDLIARNRERGSGAGVPSLAVVRPVKPPMVLVDRRTDAQIDEWKARANAAAAAPSLFDDPAATKPPFEVVPWRFRYEYRCSATECPAHRQTIIDWEVVNLWRHVRRQLDWEAAMRKKFEEQMWTGRDSVLFIGNMEQHPQSFLVLGVFWPSAGPSQTTLL